MAIGLLTASVGLAICTAPELEAQSALLRPKTEAGVKALENAISRGAEARVGDERFAVLALRTEGIDLANRAKWIETTMDRIILPNIDFRDESPQDCLEFFRRTTHRVLVRMEEQDTHIHFLRLGASEQNHRITLKSKDTTLRKALEQVARQLNSTVVVTDYGIVIKEQMQSATRPTEDPKAVPAPNRAIGNANPFEK